MRILNNEAVSRTGFWLGRSRLVRLAVAAMLVLGVMVNYSGSSFADGQNGGGRSELAFGSPLLAYSVDYEMDRARGEKTIEHYGEPVREVVEQAIRNNENNPQSKPTAENTYRREGWLNDLLPERLGQFFSKDDLLDMPNTDNPRER